MTTAAAPMVSVLLPVFNGEPYFGAALDSVLRQTYRDFELLVLDDGSTDASAAVARARAAGDARVRVISRPNRGLIVSLNELAAQARGRYLARMDADDLCLPQRFAWQVERLQADPDIVALGGRIELIDERDRYLTTLTMPADNDSIQRESLRGHTSIAHPSAMMRRDAFERVGGYRAEAHPAEDLDLWLRLGEVGVLANLAQPVLRYRLHGASISGSQVERQQQAVRSVCQAARARRGLGGEAELAAGEPWRPTPDRASQHKFMLRYGWWAFNSAQRRTCLHYGLRAVGLRPTDRRGWVLLLCALFKRLPAARAGRG